MARLWVQVYFKGDNIIKNLAIGPKGQGQHHTEIEGYLQVQLWHTGLWWEVNRGISWRHFEEGSGTPQGPLPNLDHANIMGSHTSMEISSVVGREDHTITRTIKEAMHIRINNPSLNRKIGKVPVTPRYGMRSCLISLPPPQITPLPRCSPHSANHLVNRGQGAE